MQKNYNSSQQKQADEKRPEHDFAYDFPKLKHQPTKVIHSITQNAEVLRGLSTVVS